VWLVKDDEGGYRQMSDWGEQIQQARRQADELHDQAMPLGYNASCNVAGELSQPPDVSFWVRRVDQPAGTDPKIGSG
jgi:hypothetical protein